jgi:ketosteroid isomerase-like protein
MSDQHDLLAILQAALDAFNVNDLKELSSYVAEDVTYTIHGRASVSGTYRGVEGFRSALTSVKELTGGTMEVQPEVLLAGHDVVMAYMRVTGRRTDGRRYHSHQAYLYRFRDGKLVEGQTIPVDQREFEDFFRV